jgi:predicted amidohydrolase
MKSYEYRAAAVQTLAKIGDIEANLEICEYFIKDAARQGVKLIVFPECMNVGYLYDSVEHAREVAETVDGKFVGGLGRLARQHGIYVASGITEWDPAKQKVFNSGVLLDKSGHLISHYHKQFLATHDQNWFAFGERRFPIVDTELGRLGMMICFDGRIPEISRCTALSGAQVIIDMANFFVLDQAEMWGPARAYENGVWLCAATKAGQERSIYYPGGSMIVDPRGNVRAQVPYNAHAMAVSEIDPTLADDKGFAPGADKFADRRPDVYTVLAKPYSETAVAKVVTQPIVPGEFAFKMATVQSHVCEDPATKLKDVVAQVSHGAKLGIKVLVLPEYFASPNWSIDRAEAERLASLNTDLLAQFAAICVNYGCAILVPNVEKKGDKLYPVSTLIGPDGKILLAYHKVHLFSDEREWATAGSDFPVADTPFGRIGVMMGYDGAFPESSRCLGVNGADVIVWPARLQDRKERKYLAVPRAADNRCVVLLANRVDAPFPGGSAAIPPSQFPVWDIDVVTPYYTDMHKVLFGYFDLTSARQKRLIGKVDMFANRLVETYDILVSSSAGSFVPAK